MNPKKTKTQAELQKDYEQLKKMKRELEKIDEAVENLTNSPDEILQKLN